MGKGRYLIGLGMIVCIFIYLRDEGKFRNPIPFEPRTITTVDNLNETEVSITAPSAILIDANTGKVLYANHATERHYPASITKVMTSLIALDKVRDGQLNLNSIIPVDQSAFDVARTPGLSVAYLNPSERITLQTMLEMMYVVSADDAAVAVADAVAGDQPAFASLMNQEAQSLGMTDSHFTNSSGLHDPNHYSTAHDLAILARYTIQHYPIVLQWASEQGMYIQPHQFTPTYDQLLGVYDGLDGLKTGSTSEAGYCFVGTAERNSTRLISIVLDDPDFKTVFHDTAALLNFGFQQVRSSKSPQT